MPANPDKRKREKLFEGMLKCYYRWKAFAEEEGLYSITIEGEEFSFFDLLDGIDTLPLRQRQALWLICIEGLKEREAAEMMGFDAPPGTTSTPVQFYKNKAIEKLVKYHDSEIFRRNANEKVRRKGKVWEKTKPIPLGAVFPGLNLVSNPAVSGEGLTGT
jgi:hypothetical protein